MRNDKSLTRGIILIVIGCLLLAAKLFNIQIFDWAHFWPLIVLMLGLSFELGYFLSRRNPGVLVPGGILITISLLFFFETFTNWNYSDITWPIYILSVAIGLYQLYFFGGKETDVLIASSILGIIFLISASFTFLNIAFPFVNSNLALPIILILIGVYILFRDFIYKNPTNKKDL